MFPSRRVRSKTGHLVEPKSAWRRILDRAGLGDTDTRLHDLRRSFGSFLADTHASLVTIGASLGHKSTASTAIYARVGSDPVRQANEAGVAALLADGRLDVTEDGPRLIDVAADDPPAE